MSVSESRAQQDPASERTPKRTSLLLFTNQRLVGGLRGGMERHMELVAQHVDRKRFRVFGMVPDLDSMTDFATTLGRHVDELARLTVDREHPANYVPFARQLRSWGIDVLHVQNAHYLGQNLLITTAKLAGVKKVFVTDHQAPHAPESLPARVGRVVMANLVDGLIAVSDYNLTARRKFIHTPAAKAVVVENGVDTDDFVPIAADKLAALRAEYGLSPDAEIVGSVVRFEEDKGLNYLLDAFPKILEARPNAYLVLVGEGSLRQALEQQAERLGFRERVRFTGFLGDPRPFLGLFDAFVLPVPVGSMSIALLEAMAMRCAVVITFGGEGEAVIHERTGLRAEPRNPSAIAESVIRILSDPSYRRRLGDAARAHIEEQFSARRTARRLEELYLARRSR